MKTILKYTLAGLMILAPVFLHAQEKNKLEGNLDQANQNITKLEGEQSEVQKRLSQLNGDLLSVVENINSLEEQIRTKEAEMEATQLALEEAKATESWQYESMVVQMRCMYERQDTSYLNMLLSAGGLAELLNLAYYIERIMAYDQRQMEAFVDTREIIEQEEAKLKRERAELAALEALAQAEKDRVNGLIANAQAEIAKYADQIEEAEQKAKEYEAAIKAQEETLEYLKKKLAEEKALAAAAAWSALWTFPKSRCWPGITGRASCPWWPWRGLPAPSSMSGSRTAARG